MGKPRSTVVFSVRIDEGLYQKGEFLKSRHPRTLSQSRIYFAGLESVIATLIEKGENLPEDVIVAMIKYRQDEIDALSQEIKNLRELEQKQVARAGKTHGSPAGSYRIKPGYRVKIAEDGTVIGVEV